MAIPLSVLDLSPVDSGSTGAQALRNTMYDRISCWLKRLNYNHQL